jgi:hypothetical protein
LTFREFSDPLARVLRAEFGVLNSAYVIDWVPEQGENIYTVVVRPDLIAIVEIPRDPDSSEMPAIERVPLKQYRRQRLSKLSRRALDVAIQLAAEDATLRTDPLKEDWSN